MHGDVMHDDTMHGDTMQEDSADSEELNILHLNAGYFEQLNVRNDGGAAEISGELIEPEELLEIVDFLQSKLEKLQ